MEYVALSTLIGLALALVLPRLLWWLQRLWVRHRSLFLGALRLTTIACVLLVLVWAFYSQIVAFLRLSVVPFVSDVCRRFAAYAARHPAEVVVAALVVIGFFVALLVFLRAGVREFISVFGSETASRSSLKDMLGFLFRCSVNSNIFTIFISLFCAPLLARAFHIRDDIALSLAFLGTPVMSAILTVLVFLTSPRALTVFFRN